MLRFDQFVGPYGVPVFYMRMPETVKCSAIALANFVGSADDSSVSEPGLYHWFEHVPFRGTKKFPGGYKATRGAITKVGGNLNAWTNKLCTNYHATVPTRHLRTAAAVVFDLVSQPLLEDEAIVAEREIIKQEINGAMGDAMGLLRESLNLHLYPGHAFQYGNLGTAESLDSITPGLLRKARVHGYDRSRMALFVATSLPYDAVMDLTTDLFELLPKHGLSERRRAASFGRLPWVQKQIEADGGFTDSLLQVLFHYPPVIMVKDTVKFTVLKSLFNEGGLGSPLYRALREDNQLVYKTGLTVSFSPDGSYWGFHASTSRDKLPLVHNALRKMMKDPQLRSPEWLQDIREASLNELDMIVHTPGGQVGNAVRETVQVGRPYSNEELYELTLKVSHEEAMSWLDEIDFDKATTVTVY